MANDADLKKVLACGNVVVTSPAAARFACASAVFDHRKIARWFALGEGTAEVLRKNGVAGISIPEPGNTSEHLLSMPALLHPEGQAFGLITAPGGRALIESTLRTRGADVHVAHVYRRKRIAIGPAQWRGLDRLTMPFAVLCSSHEVFESFWQQISPAFQQKLRQGLWVLSSPRLRDLLFEAGIPLATVSPSARPEAMLRHLEHVQTQQVR